MVHELAAVQNAIQHSVTRKKEQSMSSVTRKKELLGFPRWSSG